MKIIVTGGAGFIAVSYTHLIVTVVYRPSLDYPFHIAIKSKRHHPSCHDLFFNDDVECVVNARNEE